MPVRSWQVGGRRSADISFDPAESPDPPVGVQIAGSLDAALALCPSVQSFEAHGEPVANLDEFRRRR